MRERDEVLRKYETQINELHHQLSEIVALKDRVGRLQIELTQTAQEREVLAADLATSRAMVQRLRSQATPASDTTDNSEVVVAASPEASATDWYQTWLAEMTPENLERQKIALQLIGQGETFFRPEIIERLNGLS